jgi:magnesium transporter
MQALPFVRAPVPSPAVLKFLRIQAECLPFLASHSQVRRNHHHTPTDTARSRIWTSAQCRASLKLVERQTLVSPCRGFWNSATKLRWQKPWQQVRPKKTAPLQPNDLPPLPRLLDDAGAASLGRIVKPTNELRMRCTEFDGDGKVTLVNGAFKKSELIAKVSLYNHHSPELHLTTLPRCRIFSYALRPS